MISGSGSTTIPIVAMTKTTSKKPCRTGTMISTRTSSRRCAIGSRSGWTTEESCPRPDSRAKDLILETASERWTALTPAERQQWLDQRRSRLEQRRATGSASSLTPDQRAALSERAADLSPQQRAALRESAQGTSFDRVSGRRAGGGVHRSMSSHPTPSRAGLSGGTRFRAARGGGRGGRGRGR